MSIYRKKAVSKYLPRACFIFGIEAVLKAIQFSYFLGVIKALTAQLLNNKNKLPALDA